MRAASQKITLFVRAAARNKKVCSHREESNVRHLENYGVHLPVAVRVARPRPRPPQSQLHRIFSIFGSAAMYGLRDPTKNVQDRFYLQLGSAHVADPTACKRAMKH